MRIAAVDPGATTGWVVAEGCPPTLLGCGEAVQLGELQDVLVGYRPQVVVVESFRLYPWRAKALGFSRMQAAEAIGTLRAWAQDIGITWVEQQPAVKDTVSRKVLEALGLWAPTRGKPHARDAARHLAHYLIVTSRSDPELLRQLLRRYA